MTTIRILPDLLANQIAAGEVVERPASVVKELVENALDAQSSRILIDIEEGGRTLIRVADNGHGMAADDALLCLERFATSKLRGESDLFAIKTLGFRGEALPSIAAVSHLTLITRAVDAPNGVQVEVRGGQISTVTEIGAPHGTMISIGRLFFNTPARRKFLKGTATELAHIADTVAGMALGWPQVHLRLTHNAKIVHQWPRVENPAERAAAVLGQVERQELIPVDVCDDSLTLTGYVAPARFARATARAIYVFVNGRRVRDRVVQHALFEAYHGRLIKSRFPVAVLFLTLPFDQVDVNVHPAKHEIRFADQRRVHRLVQKGVITALARSERRLWTQQASLEPTVGGSMVHEPLADYDAPSNRAKAGAYNENVPKPLALPLMAQPAENLAPGMSPSTPLRAQPAQPYRQADPAPGCNPPVRQRFAELTVIGQFQGTYIICQSEAAELIVIDQHAAHERIVYERLSRSNGHIEAQRLLLPATVELGFAEARALEPLLPSLNGLGLEIEPFGGSTWVVKTMPVVLDPNYAEHLVRELAEKALESGETLGLERILDQCRMVMACHRAVRAHQTLDPREIRSLLAELDQCAQPSHCPHGRPTWIRWTLRELEKMFGRTA